MKFAPIDAMEVKLSTQNNSNDVHEYINSLPINLTADMPVVSIDVSALQWLRKLSPINVTADMPVVSIDVIAPHINMKLLPIDVIVVMLIAP